MVARRAFMYWLQEEERERRMDFIPDESAINTEAIEVRQLVGLEVRLHVLGKGARGHTIAAALCKVQQRTCGVRP